MHFAETRFMRFFRRKSDAIKICKTETRVLGAPTNIKYVYSFSKRF